MKNILKGLTLALAISTSSAHAGFIVYSVTINGVKGASLDMNTDDCMYTMGIMENNFKKKVGKIKTSFEDFSQKDWARKVLKTKKHGLAELSMTCYY